MDKIKALFIAHGEKLLAAFCVLFGFLALSSAQWVPNSDNASQVEVTANKSKQKIGDRENAWPEAEKLAFLEIKDVRDLTAVDTTYKVDAGNFSIADFNPSNEASLEKRSMVTVIAAIEGTADFITFPLAMPPEKIMIAKEPQDAITPKVEGNAFDQLLEAKFGRNKQATLAEADGYGAGAPGIDPGDVYDAGTEQLGTDLMSKEKRIRVSAGVSVRYVVDIQEQRAEIRKALKLGTDFQEAQQHIQYTDIQVQRRQRSVALPEWSHWEDLSSEDLGEILENSLGLDRDVVSPAVTRNTITMPLPRRGTGTWQASEVSHPLVENFEVKAWEAELIDQHNAKMLAKFEEQRSNLPLNVEEKGFSQFSSSTSDLRFNQGVNTNFEEDDFEDFESQLSDDDGELSEADKKNFLDKANATAENRLLLVRFMDFTVDRGNQYEYRVRLVMRNPNLNIGLDQLEDPSMGTEPELLSAWSEVSPAIGVPAAYRTYAEKVDARPGRPENIVMSIYTDTTETGLPVLASVKTAMGLPVAGKKLMKVVDLRNESLTTKDVLLATEAVLGDAESLERISSSDHPELADILRKLERGQSLIQNQVTLIREDGALFLRSVGDNTSQLLADKREQEFILQTYSVWEDKPDGDGGFFGASDLDDEDDDSPAGLGLGGGSSASGAFFNGGAPKKRISSRERARQRRKEREEGLQGGGGSGTIGGY